MELTSIIFTVIGATATVVGTIVAIYSYKKANKKINEPKKISNIKKPKIKAGDNSTNIIGNNNNNNNNNIDSNNNNNINNWR